MPYNVLVENVDGPWNHPAWVQVLPLLVANCVILGKLLILSVSPFLITVPACDGYLPITSQPKSTYLIYDAPRFL